MKRIHAIIHKELNITDYHRIIIPYKELNIPFQYSHEVNINLFDICIIHYGICDLNFIKFCHEYGKIVILDIDDHWLMPKSHDLFKRYEKFNRFDGVKALIKECDYITTTTQYLASKLLIFNKKVQVFPNCINPKTFTNCNYKKEVVTFGYTGNDYHFSNVKLLEGISNILKGYNYKINFYSNNKQYATIFGENCNIYKKLHIEEYMNVYNMHNVTIIPLRDDMYTNCKSPLKIAESGMFSMPVICSDIEPYKIIENYKTGFKCDNLLGFASAMKFYINNPEYIKIHGENLNKVTNQLFNLESVSKKRLDFLNSI